MAKKKQSKTKKERHNRYTHEHRREKNKAKRIIKDVLRCNKDKSIIMKLAIDIARKSNNPLVETEVISILNRKNIK